MVSLKKTIEGLDREEERFRSLVEYYLSTVKAVQEHAVVVTPEAAQDFQTRLRRLHNAVSGNSALETIGKSRDELVVALREYRSHAADALAKKEDDLRAIIQTLGVAAESFSGHNKSQSTRLKEFTTQLQNVARGTDLSQMRSELTRHVDEFKLAAEAMWRESQQSVDSMQLQLVEIQKRLDRAENRARTDALTGLTNRGEGERRLREAMKKGNPVSVVLMDLNGFKQVNDRWGHSAGDQVLKTFAHNLARQVSPPDFACRWGGDEFLVVLNLKEDLARARAAQLRPKLRMTHKLVVLSRIIEVEVGAALGIAQARPGEALESMLTRADAELYAQKPPTRVPTGGMPSNV